MSWFIPLVNLLNTRRTFCKDSVRTAQCTLSTSVIKINLLDFYKVKFAVCSEIHTEHTNLLSVTRYIQNTQICCLFEIHTEHKFAVCSEIHTEHTNLLFAPRYTQNTQICCLFRDTYRTHKFAVCSEIHTEHTNLLFVPRSTQNTQICCLFRDPHRTHKFHVIKM